MSETITCFACDEEPTQQCSRCGRPYCDEHGADFCDVCLEPTSGLPSFSVYRGSLFALIIGGALALWLLIQPTSDGDANVRALDFTATIEAGAGAVLTPGAGGNATPAGALGTATAQATLEPTPPSTSAGGTYTVVSGDILSTICEDNKPPQMSLGDCVDEFVRLNGLSSADDISVGEELQLPQ